MKQHEPAPFAIAKDGDDDIEGVETGLERNVLIEIKHTGDDIDSNPDEPLLQIFMSQSPDADEAQRSGKAVGQRYIGIGERDQQPIDDSPYHSNET